MFCQDFNNYVEEEKKRRHESLQQVQKFAMAWEKTLQEESEKKVAGLYEKLQESLETIQTGLSSVETSEGQLQKVVSFPHSFLSISLLLSCSFALLKETVIQYFRSKHEPKASKEDLDTVEDGQKNSDEMV